MIVRIILTIIVVLICLLVVYIIIPMWKLVTTTIAVFKIYEMMFDIFPEEGQQIFVSGRHQEITCGKITLNFTNMQEACYEFEKCINELFAYYDQHSWLCEHCPNLQKDRDRVYEIGERIEWLESKN